MVDDSVFNFIETEEPTVTAPTSAGVTSAPASTPTSLQPLPTPGAVTNKQAGLMNVAGDMTREGLDSEEGLRQARAAGKQGLDSAVEISQLQTENINKGLEKQIAAEKQAAEADKDTPEMQAAVQKYGSDLEMLSGKYVEKQKLAEKNYLTAQDNYLRTVGAASQTKIYNWWAEAPTGAKILGIISQAAAGFANYMLGQPGAPTPLEKIIDDDLRLQMAKNQEAKDKVGIQKGIFLDMKKSLEDNNTAYLAGMDVALQSTLARAKQQALASKDAKAQANLAKFIAQVETIAGENRNKVLESLKGSAERKAATDSGLIQAWAGFANGFDKTLASALAAGGKGSGSGDLQKGAYTITGVAGSEQLDAATRKELKASIDGAEQLQSSVEIINKDPKQATEQATIVTFALKDILGTGNISEGEYGMIAGIVGISPQSLISAITSGDVGKIATVLIKDPDKMARLAKWGREKAQRQVSGVTVPGGQRLAIDWNARKLPTEGQ